MLNVVWFKRDLRVTDHLPLTRAVAGGGVVLPLYIVEPDFWAQPSASARQWRFVARALAALRAQLAVRGAPLVVRVGDAVDVLDEIRRASHEFALWSHEETGEPWARARDGRVADWARAHAIPWHEFPGSGVVRGAPPRDGWSAEWRRRMGRAPLPAPGAMLAHGLPSGRIVSDRILRLPEDGSAEQPAGPQPARRLLDDFLSGQQGGAGGSAAGADAGAGAGSRLSPHLAWGTLSVRETCHAAMQARAARPPGPSRRPLDRFLVRLRQRCRTVQRLEDAPGIARRCIDPRCEGLRPQALRGAADEARLAAWLSGRTGLPLVDASMRALDATGWLHHDLRALVASVAANLLWLDWRVFGPALGRLFTDLEPGIHLVHCQVQSGTAGRPPRIADPVREGLARDPDGGFVRRWVPELARVPAPAIHAPWTMSAAAQAAAGCRIGADYPAPLVDPAAAARAARERLALVRGGQPPA